MNVFEDAIERGEIDLGEYGGGFANVDELCDYLLAPESRTVYPHCLLYEGIVNKVGVQVMFDARSLILWLMPASKDWTSAALDDAIFELTGLARLILASEEGGAA